MRDHGHVQPNPHIVDGEMGKNQIRIDSCVWLDFCRWIAMKESWIGDLDALAANLPRAAALDDDVWRELDNSAKTLYSTERFILQFMTFIHAQNLFRLDVDNIVRPKKLRH
jgi:hypothetical protein